MSKLLKIKNISDVNIFNIRPDGKPLLPTESIKGEFSDAELEHLGTLIEIKDNEKEDEEPEIEIEKDEEII